ncbi:hypothetical protein [Geosporobacter ferrireducens]|uniref:hypothetical protein n=1 Tax=Geosporobacter ferrireducens TaxID=1424294 RepID=UPI00139CB1DD|nr:hypothetical protein [Geosporobacter ferrireducens]MTI56123.1 hypothetical protein [Geosporobacter ferrireducens]
MKKPIETGNLVEEYMQRNVRVRIFDSAYAGKTKADIDKILKEIGEIAYHVFSVKSDVTNEKEAK